MIIGNGKYICDVCADYYVCKDREAFKQFYENVGKMKKAYPELKTRLICDRFKATRFY